MRNAPIPGGRTKTNFDFDTTPTKTELDITRLVNCGHKNKEIADIIGITENVVKNLLCSLYDKLGLWNRVELALWYEARVYEGSFPQA